MIEGDGNPSWKIEIRVGPILDHAAWRGVVSSEDFQHIDGEIVPYLAAEVTAGLYGRVPRLKAFVVDVFHHNAPVREANTDLLWMGFQR